MKITNELYTKLKEADDRMTLGDLTNAELYEIGVTKQEVLDIISGFPQAFKEAQGKISQAIQQYEDGLTMPSPAPKSYHDVKFVDDLPPKVQVQDIPIQQLDDLNKLKMDWWYNVNAPTVDEYADMKNTGQPAEWVPGEGWLLKENMHVNVSELHSPPTERIDDPPQPKMNTGSHRVFPLEFTLKDGSRMIGHVSRQEDKSPPTERIKTYKPYGPKGDRKDCPLQTGCLDYFPAALLEVSRLSKIGNDKHNPGEAIHWARGKSTDQSDALLRHQQQVGEWDDDPTMRGHEIDHAVHVAWRALAQCQLILESRGAPKAKAAK